MILYSIHSVNIKVVTKYKDCQYHLVKKAKLKLKCKSHFNQSHDKKKLNSIEGKN